MTSPSPTTFSATSTVELGATRSGVIQLRREWPAADPRAVILLLHGIAEHSGRYEHVGRYLSERGFGVVSYDKRGYGQSGGRRGWIMHFDDYLDDVEDHLRQLGEIGVPVVLLGHSLGGLIATHYAVSDRPQPDLFVVTSPPIASFSPNAALDRLPSVLAPLFGGVRLGANISSSVLSRDEAVSAAYDADPLVDTKATLELLRAFADSIGHTRDNLDRIRRPMLAMAGEADELVPPVSTKLLDGRQGVDTIFYPENRHEILNELEWEKTVEDMITWLEPKTRSAARLRSAASR